MVDNVVPFPGIVQLDVAADEMLRAIADENPKQAFVITFDDDELNSAEYFASTGSIALILLHLNAFIHGYFNGRFG